MRKPSLVLLSILLLIAVVLLCLKNCNPSDVKIVSEEVSIERITLDTTKAAKYITTNVAIITTRDQVLLVNKLYSSKTDSITLVDTTYTVDTFIIEPIITPEDELAMRTEFRYSKNRNAIIRADDFYEAYPSEYKSLSKLALEPTTIIPIKFHDILKSDGTGNPKKRDHFSICIEYLNERFAEANIIFALCGDINYIYDTKLYTFPKIKFEDNYKYNFHFLESIMAKYNVAKTLNIYLVDNMFSGTAGMFPGQESAQHPENMLVLRKKFLLHGVVEHEIGHWFYLRHTHYNEDKNQTTLELVDGSNCKTAGDKICDTEADPNLGEKMADIGCSYIGNQLDRKGNAYNPDVHNFMSYTLSRCKKEFTNEQLIRMAIMAKTELRNFISGENCNSINPITDNNLDIGISDIIITNRQQNSYNIEVNLFHEGNINTPLDEKIELKYFINGKEGTQIYIYESIPVGKLTKQIIPISIASTDTILTVSVEISELNNDQNKSNNKLSYTHRIRSENSGRRKKPVEPIPVKKPVNEEPIIINTAGKNCDNSTLLKLNQVYKINLDYNLTSHDSGFWFSFFVPQNILIKQIKIYEVSENFDPVIGVKSNCAYANFIADDYNEKEDNLLNSFGIGKNETFYNHFLRIQKDNNGLYHFKITNHKKTQPKASFKVVIK